MRSPMCGVEARVCRSVSAPLMDWQPVQCAASLLTYSCRDRLQPHSWLSNQKTVVTFKRLSKNADFEKYFALFVYQFPSKVYLTVVLSVYRLRTRTYTDRRKHTGDVRMRSNMLRRIRKQEIGENELPPQRFPIPCSAPHFLSHNFPPLILTLYTQTHTYLHIPTAILMTNKPNISDTDIKPALTMSYS